MFVNALLLLISLSVQLVTSERKPYHFGMCLTRDYGDGKCIEHNRCDFYNTNLLVADAEKNCYSRQRPDLVCCPTTPNVLPALAVRSGHVDELPRHPHCGTSFNARIVNGERTELFEFPWTTLLEYTYADGTKHYDCGASFIAQRWLLTAAHCVHKHFLETRNLTGARLGEWNTTTNPDCITYANGKKECAPPFIQASIDLHIIHPEFEVNNLTHDIALLRLSEPVNWHKQLYLEPICLPPARGKNADQLVGSAVFVSGWGKTNEHQRSDVKRKALLHVKPQQLCIDLYKNQRYILNDGQFCASGGNKVDACTGDSGGPVTLEAFTPQRDRFVYLAGIVSYGRLLCGQSDFPGVYTRVSEYMDWIEQSIRENKSLKSVANTFWEAPLSKLD